MDTVVRKPSFKGLSFSLSTTPETTTTTSFTNSLFFSSFKFTSFNRKPKRTSIAVSYNPHSNPTKPNNHNQPITPKAGGASIPRWVSVFGGFGVIPFKSSIAVHTQTSILPDEDLNGGCLQNGGLGMAILSVKSSAEGKISPFLATLAANPTFVSGFVAWAVAQSAKVILNFFVERRWDLKILFASGGMPSSHSALCTAMTTSVAICHGVADSLFPVCLGFSLIVMYDAIGVRRHAGMQAEVLNLIVEDLFQGHPISKRKLKELLGHTPSQVIAGALLGIVVAFICCRGCLVAP